MRRLIVALVGLLVVSPAMGATPEEAAKLFSASQWEAAAAAYQDIVDKNPANTLAWFRLARARAASGDASKALEALKGWIGTGNAAYQPAMTVPELQSLHADPRFVALVEGMKPCVAAEFRQFDFWLGDWNVESPASPGVVSHNQITSINDGCTLREQYTTPSGYAGTSLNFYDATKKAWHQTWIDNQGGALYLDGGFDGKSMVLSATTDPTNFNRITWTPLDDGRVRQLWEASTDGGKTWTTAFDGYYSRR